VRLGSWRHQFNRQAAILRRTAARPFGDEGTNGRNSSPPGSRSSLRRLSAIIHHSACGLLVWEAP
jgi:hypothetical protein